MAPNPDTPAVRVVKDVLPDGVDAADERGEGAGNNYLLVRPFVRPAGTATGHLLVSRYQDAARMRMRFDHRQIGVLKHSVPPDDNTFFAETMSSNTRKAIVADCVLREVLESCFWSDLQMPKQLVARLTELDRTMNTSLAGVSSIDVRSSLTSSRADLESGASTLSGRVSRGVSSLLGADAASSEMTETHVSEKIIVLYSRDPTAWH
eukprot:2463867-Amphidinium_carterae.1